MESPNAAQQVWEMDKLSKIHSLTKINPIVVTVEFNPKCAIDNGNYRVYFRGMETIINSNRMAFQTLNLEELSWCFDFSEIYRLEVKWESEQCKIGLK